MNAVTHTWSSPAKAAFVGVHQDTSPINVTLVLQLRTDITLSPAVLGGTPALTHAEFWATHGAHPDDIASILEFAHTHGLTVLKCDGHRRVIQVQGTPDALQRAFNVELHRYELHDGSATFTTTSKEPTLPAGAMGVLGLDQRPVAKPYFRAHVQAHDDPWEGLSNTYTPVQLGEIYNFPKETDGTGETIAIIELGGGYTDENLQQYFAELGVKTPFIEAISVMGATHTTGSDADGEVQLDIEIAGALALGAKYAVYFTPNTDEGFAEAISQAAHDPARKISVMSISWGAAENVWTPQAIRSVQAALEDAAALGITITVAAGDNGASDGQSFGLHADFPSSSPSVLACGGTKLYVTGTHITQESVWDEQQGATGGGVSQVFGKPTWQSGAIIPSAPNGFDGRGLPDVAAVADPVTGYRVRINGVNEVFGGTSAVAPLWAALIARINQALKRRVGALNQTVYTLPRNVFHDITAGTNVGYGAQVGWDPTTGFGSPDGTALLTALEALK